MLQSFDDISLFLDYTIKCHEHYVVSTRSGRRIPHPYSLILEHRSKIGVSRAGGSRSRAGVSTGVSGHTGTGIESLKVFHDGINVTPQSLLHSASSAPAHAPRKGSSGSPTTKRPSAAGGGGVAPRKKSSLSSDTHAAAAAVRAEGVGGGVAGGRATGRRKRDGQAEEGRPTEEDLKAPIAMELRETPTMMLLVIQGSAVATDLREFSRWVLTEKHGQVRTVYVDCLCLRCVM